MTAGARGGNGDRERALVDYSAATDMPDAPVDQQASAYFNMACACARNRQVDEAIPGLKRWADPDPAVSPGHLDGDADVDPIRAQPTCVAFRDSLPP